MESGFGGRSTLPSCRFSSSSWILVSLSSTKVVFASNNVPRLRLLRLLDLLHLDLLALASQRRQVRGRGIRGLLRHCHPYLVPLPLHSLLHCYLQEAGSEGSRPCEECSGRNEGREGPHGWRSPPPPQRHVAVDCQRLCFARGCRHPQRQGDALPQGINAPIISAPGRALTFMRRTFSLGFFTHKD